jgi:hypothetical protein
MDLLGLGFITFMLLGYEDELFNFNQVGSTLLPNCRKGWNVLLPNSITFYS